MLFIELLMAVCVAAVATGVVVAIVGWDGYAAGGWATGVVVFGLFVLVVWAGGVWLTPFGPEVFGAAAAWVPFLITGFLGALFLAAISPLRRPTTAHAAEERAQAKEVATTTLIVIAWVTAIVASSALVMHYVAVHDWKPTVRAPAPTTLAWERQPVGGVNRVDFRGPLTR